MAAKRTANSDLNHDNWDNEEEAEEAGTFAVANPEVLKDRVIKKAKRRGVATDGSAPSVFAGFGGFKTASTTSATTTASTGAFDFLASDSKNGSGSSASPKNSFSFTSPDKAVSDGVAKSVAPVFAFGTGSAPRDPAFGASKPAATGFSFGAKPTGNEPEKKSTFAFGEKSEVKTGFSFGGEKPKPSESGLAGFAFGKSPSNEPVKPPGFLFGEKSSINEPAKPSGFGFGDKSESAAKPSFSFGGANKTDSPKTGFSFGTKSESSPKKDEEPKPSLMDLFKPKAGSWTCSVCDVTNDADKSACVACTTPNPAAAASPAPVAKKWECPSCMVYNEAEKDSCVCCETAKPGTKAKPSTGFGSGIFGSGVSSGSGFKFGVTPTTTSATESGTALGFKFGDSSSSTKTSFGDSAKPSGFQFGTGSSASSTESGFRDKDSESNSKKPEDKEYPKEFLSSLKSLNSDVLEWVKTHVERNAYVYLSPVFKDYENHLAELKAKHKVTSTAAVPSAPTTMSKPIETGFKFGNGSASTTPSAAPAAPSFSFGTTGDGSKKKDSFTFGSGSSGSTIEPAKTGFTFGSGSFGSAGGSTTFGSFGSAAAAAAVKSADAKDDNDDDENDEPPKVEVAPVVEEDSIYSVRCKLFYKKGKEFADKGLGMMHLKPVEGTKKTQILVRAETSLGNILLNVMLNNQMSLLKRNNNIQFVCVPNPPIPGLDEGPVTMLVKVKNAEMADELEAKMKERLENE